MHHVDNNHQATVAQITVVRINLVITWHNIVCRLYDIEELIYNMLF